MGRHSGSQGDQGAGLEGLRGSWAIGLAYRVPGGQGVGVLGSRGSRGRPTDFQGERGRLIGSRGQVVGLLCPRGSRGRPKRPKAYDSFSDVGENRVWPAKI